MATYTPNYQLHQWVPEDQFLRTDFNEDFKKIDTALGQKAEKSSTSSSISSIQSSMNSQFSSINSAITALEGRVQVVVGGYAGNGTLPRTISLGFTPKAVLLEHRSGERIDGSSVYGGLFSPDMPLVNESHTYAEIVTNGFRLNNVQYYNQLNRSGERYTYLAFR